MTIERTTENGSVVLMLSGELTAMVTEQLNTAIEAAVGENDFLVLDFADLEYLASAGLRVLLRAKKMLSAKGGKFLIRNVNEDVMSVFEITGFSNILEIQ